MFMNSNTVLVIKVQRDHRNINSWKGRSQPLPEKSNEGS